MQGLGPSGRPAHRAQALHLAAIWQVVKVSCCRTATDFIARLVQCHGFVTASGCLRGPLWEGPDPRPPRLGTRQLQGARRPENGVGGVSRGDTGVGYYGVAGSQPEGRLGSQVGTQAVARAVRDGAREALRQAYRPPRVGPRCDDRELGRPQPADGVGGAARRPQRSRQLCHDRFYTPSFSSDRAVPSPKSGASATQASAALSRDAWAPSSRARRASPRKLYSPVAWSTSPSSRARSAPRLTRVNVSSFKSRCSAASGWA